MEAYLDPKHPGSFREVQALSRHTGIEAEKAQEWFSGKDAYTLHKQVKIKTLTPKNVCQRHKRVVASGLGGFELASKFKRLLPIFANLH